MKLSDFDYNLPPELIAVEPAKPRGHSRLLVLNKKTGRIEHHTFYEIINFLKPGDLLVMNNSKVFPARLIGKKAITHGKVEILLNHEIDTNLWQCVGKNLKVGSRIIFPDSKLEAIVEDRKDSTYSIRFNLNGNDFFAEVDKIGQIPLPPYIIEARETKKKPGVDGPKHPRGENFDDRNHYQTVYAKDTGSVAAPTAGLHFTDELLDKIRAIGVEILEVTLHVGLGTFAPVKSENIEEHQTHSEYYSIKKEILKKIIKAKTEHRRIIAVGTTTTRVLEHIFSDLLIHDTGYLIRDLSGWTNIFIYSGYKFKCIDALITNFHLPKSSLLMLVSALAGYDNIIHTYEEAIKERYRFYSYGDAVLII